MVFPPNHQLLRNRGSALLPTPPPGLRRMMSTVAQERMIHPEFDIKVGGHAEVFHTQPPSAFLGPAPAYTQANDFRSAEGYTGGFTDPPPSSAWCPASSCGGNANSSLSEAYTRSHFVPPRSTFLAPPLVHNRVTGFRPPGGYTGGFSDVQPPSRPAQMRPDETVFRPTLLRRLPHQPISESPSVNIAHSSASLFDAQAPMAPSTSIANRDTRSRIPERFFSVTRAHFKVIKCLHHLQRLSQHGPSALFRFRNQLANSLEPAFVSADFRTSLASLADNWSLSALRLLKDHYSLKLDEALSAIRDLPMPSDLLDISFSLVCSWARKQLGRKLQRETLSSAWSLIVTSCLHPPSEQDVQGAQQPHPSQSSSENAVVASPPEPCPPSNRLLESTVSINDAQDVLPTLPDASTFQPAAPLTINSDLASRSIPAGVSTVPQQDDHTNLDASFTSIGSDARSVTSRVGDPMDPTTVTATSAPSQCDVSLIMGDVNVASFDYPRCRVVGLPNGRLSGLLHFARTQLFPSTSITKVFVCLSTLDRRNRLITLTSTSKSLLSKCHCLFPNATLFVLLCGVSSDFSPNERETQHEFSSFLRNKHPSNCIVLSPPSSFSSSQDVWSEEVRSATFDRIREHLNSSS